ncbi:MAG TPA: antitoxin Xre/MbcA/ParS toxin-binding domain-containing protein [Myxococcales bacterium]
MGSDWHEVIRLLGGEAALGSRPRTERDLVGLIREGFSTRVLVAIMETVGGLDTLAEVTHLNKRTLQRRLEGGPRATARNRLTAEESERLARLARVVAAAESVFRDEKKARTWLGRENRALGQVPMTLLDTDLGTQAVLDELGRIAHGTFA